MLDDMVEMYEERHMDGGDLRDRAERLHKLSCLAFTVLLAVSGISILYNLILVVE